VLTLNDCIALSDLLPEEIEEISRHERLGFVPAMAKRHSLLNQPWGPPAIRQILRDNLTAAMRNPHTEQCGRVIETYHAFEARHPGGIDRRKLR
jgi:hypothetical protein